MKDKSLVQLTDQQLLAVIGGYMARERELGGGSGGGAYVGPDDLEERLRWRFLWG